MMTWRLHLACVTLTVGTWSSFGGEAPYPAKWSVEVASRLSSPPVRAGSVVWISSKGSVQARALDDGSRVFRVKSRGFATLAAIGPDSVLVLERHPKGRVRMFSSTPPRVVLDKKFDRAIIDGDAAPAHLALLLRHQTIRLFSRGRWTSGLFPRASGPGWSDIDVVARGEQATVILSKRSGEMVLSAGDTLIRLPLTLPGGVAKALVEGDSLLLVGREGTMVLLDQACRVIWQTILPSGLQFGPVVTPSCVWAALRDRTLICIRRDDGTRQGEWHLPGPLTCPIETHREGVLWAAFTGEVGFVTATGTTADPPLEFPRTVVGIASADSNIVLATGDGRLICLAAFR